MGVGSSRGGAAASIFDFFDIGEKIGSGNFGQVLECTSKSQTLKSKEALAVKVVDLLSNQAKATEAFQAARDELDIMEGLDHPRVVKLIQVFEDRRFLYVVMERIEGGELFEALKTEQVEIVEADVARVGLQLLEALEYIHSCNIVHRDVKAQNILLTERPHVPGRALQQADIKLIDFGLAARLHKECCRTGDRQLDTVCGTPAMCAPEIWATQAKALPLWRKKWGTRYGEKVDIYAAGVVLYLALIGTLPFQAVNSGKLANKVCSPSEQPSYESPHGDHKVSQTCRDCISAMLEKDPKKRVSAAKAVKHAWFSRRTRGVMPVGIPLEVRRSAAREAEAALALMLSEFPATFPTPQEQWERFVALDQAKSTWAEELSDTSCSSADELSLDRRSLVVCD